MAEFLDFRLELVILPRLELRLADFFILPAQHIEPLGVLACGLFLSRIGTLFLAPVLIGLHIGRTRFEDIRVILVE